MRAPQIIFTSKYNGWCMVTKVYVDYKHVATIVPVGPGSLYGTAKLWKIIAYGRTLEDEFDTKDAAKEKIRRMLG